MLTRYSVSLLALAAGAIAQHAAAADLKGIAGVKPEPDAVLGELRGGFVTAGGLTFDIGITTSTYINGQLALRTSVATSPTVPTAPTGPTGPTGPTQPTASGGGSASGGGGSGGAPPVTIQTSAPTATGGSGLGPVTTTSTNTQTGPTSQGPTSQDPTQSSTQVQTPTTPAGQTVTTTTAGGQTTVIQNPSQLLNVVTNAANDQTIALDTQVNVVLPGFDAVQRTQLLSAMGMKVGADGAFGIVSSLPH